MPEFDAVLGAEKFGPRFPICGASIDLGDIWWAEVYFKNVRSASPHC